MLTNAGGRSRFQNVGRTERHGAEASLRWQLTPTWRTTVAATLLDATYTDGFLTCAACRARRPTVPVPPATASPARSAARLCRAGVAAAGRAPSSAVELRAQAKTPVNDINSDFARPASRTLGAARAARDWARQRHARWSCCARIDNVTDRAYAGSVIVNEGNGRFFETAPPRSYLLGVRVGQAF